MNRFLLDEKAKVKIEVVYVQRVKFSPQTSSSKCKMFQGGTWGRKKEREGWGFSRFWHSRPLTGQC
ncbi:unnamed protein product [Spirodela intermedia]|uniref:Uncharacterized protein n=1 Tax=Spirodela intermedia TaxID=51605 RepID=A0A7I8IE14_SPIIN|nr:unnamed protein product [Spirodela intermedia]CAA6655625.1 unnamed protein product [Spirodela intermedia]